MLKTVEVTNRSLSSIIILYFIPTNELKILINFEQIDQRSSFNC